MTIITLPAVSAQALGKLVDTTLPVAVPDDAVTAPFVVLYDTAEQIPWRFAGLYADARQKHRPLLVPTKRKHLGEGCGDYTIEGFEARIAIERKSLVNIYGTVLAGRDRFERELRNLNEHREYAAVVVEAEWNALASFNSEDWDYRQLTETQRANRRHTVISSILAWSSAVPIVNGVRNANASRFPHVRWFFMPGRAAAENWAYRIFERWYRDNVEEK